MSDKQKKILCRIIVSVAVLAACSVLSAIFNIPKYLEIAMYLVPYGIIKQTAF